MTGNISVIIPVYNGERYLSYAIESVLSQTLLPAEVIIVDDGSSDDTMSIANRYRDRITYIYKEHSGVAHTRNVGIKHARCGYIAFLDADDLWLKEKLEIQMRAIQSHPVDMVFGYIEQFISPEIEERETNKLKIIKHTLPGYSTNTLFIQKETFLRVGLFKTEYRFGEFIEWFSRAIDYGLKYIMSPEILAKRRLHLSNMTRSASKDKKLYVKTIKSILDRRRLKSTQNDRDTKNES